MRQIEIDDEVLQHLESKSIPFVDTTPNLTLRRLLGLNGSSALSIPKPKQSQANGGVLAEKMLAELVSVPSIPMRGSRGRSKQQKADLPSLIRAGIVRQGEKLSLVDYQAKKIPGYETTVANNLLVWEGQHYSMSDLARMLLKTVGYTSDSVRGPAHWCNASGKTIKELWAQYLLKNNKQ